MSDGWPRMLQMWPEPEKVSGNYCEVVPSKLAAELYVALRETVGDGLVTDPEVAFALAHYEDSVAQPAANIDTRLILERVGIR